MKSIALILSILSTSTLAQVSTRVLYTANGSEMNATVYSSASPAWQIMYSAMPIPGSPCTGSGSPTSQPHSVLAVETTLPHSTGVVSLLTRWPRATQDGSSDYLEMTRRAEP